MRRWVRLSLRFLQFQIGCVTDAVEVFNRKRTENVNFSALFMLFCYFVIGELRLIRNCLISISPAGESDMFAKQTRYNLHGKLLY